MGTALTAATIGKNTHFASDVVLDDVALESSGTTTSDEFLLAQTLGRTEIRFVATTVIATASDNLTFSVVTADATGGSFNNTVATRVVTGLSFAVGDTVAAFVMPQGLVEPYTKVTVLSDYDASDESVSCYTVEV